MATNLYDDAVDQVIAETPLQTPAAPPDPYDDAVNQVLTKRQDAQRGALRQALDTTPDRAAEARKLADEAGLPLSVVERHFDEVKRKATLARAPLEQIATETPKLGAWLADPDNAKIASDDIEPLRGLARTLSGTATDVGVTVLKGFGAIPQAGLGLLDIATLGAAGQAAKTYLGYDPARDAGTLSAQYSPAQQQAQRTFAEAIGLTGKFEAAITNPSLIGHAILESLPLMLAGGGVGRVLSTFAKVGSVVAASIGEGVLAAGSAAEQTRQQTPGGNLTVGQAGLAVTSGALTSAFGVLGGKIAQKFGIADVDTLLAGAASPATRKGLARAVVEGAVQEGLLEELPQSIQEQVLANAAVDKPLMEGVDEAAVMGFFAGFVMGGGVQLMPATAGSPTARAQQAEQDQEFFTALASDVKGSKTVTRLPEAAQALVADLTKDGPVAHVYLSGEALQTLFQDQALETPQGTIQGAAAIADFLTGKPDALAEATRTGVDLEIPTAAYAVHLAGTTHHASLVEELRLGSPDRMNARESKAFREAEATKGDEPVTEEPAQASSEADQIKEDILQKIQAAVAGSPIRYTTKQLAGKAQLFSAFAATFEGEGLDPVETLKKWGLLVTGPQEGQPTPSSTAPQPAGATIAQEAIQAAPPVVSPEQAAVAASRPLSAAASAARITELETELRTATRAAEVDPLTGAANRAALDKALPAAEADPDTSVVVFDANNFGQVNKLVGQAAGDAMLRRIADAIAQAATDAGVGARVFRRGGDEFVVLAPKGVAEQLRARAVALFGAQPLTPEGYFVTDSDAPVFVSLSGTVGATFEEADRTLQTAKATAKGGLDLLAHEQRAAEMLATANAKRMQRTLFQGLIETTDIIAPPWQSRLINAVAASTQTKASGAQWIATIKNSKLGINLDEFALTSVNDLEKGKSYTKQEVLDYLAVHQVQVSEVLFGDAPAGPRREEWVEERAQELYDAAVNDQLDNLDLDVDYRAVEAEVVEFEDGSWGYALDGDDVGTYFQTEEDAQAAADEAAQAENDKRRDLAEQEAMERARERAEEQVSFSQARADAQNEWDSEDRDEGSTHFAAYQLPSTPGFDADSYREAFVVTGGVQFLSGNEGLLAEASARQTAVFDLDKQRRDILAESARRRQMGAPRAELDALLQKHMDLGDQLDAARVAVTTAASQVKTTSWEDGHEQYSNVVNPIVRVRFNTRIGTATDGTATKLMFLEEAQPPSADNQASMPPIYLKNWREIGFKWALRYAAEHGYDGIAWTTGEQQAARYSLEKQVTSIAWKPFGNEGDRRVEIPLQSGGAPLRFVVDGVTGVISGAQTTPSEPFKGQKLEAAVGKAVADRILASDTGTLEGEGLKIGGEGLKRLYDVDFKNVVNKLPAVKATGGKVTTFDIGLREDTPAETPILQPGLTLTPAIKAAVLGGQTLFHDPPGTPPSKPIARGGITPATDTGWTANPFFGPDLQFTIQLFENADITTFTHESAHLFLKIMQDLAARPQASARLTADMTRLNDWFFGKGNTGTIGRAEHERFANAFNLYLSEGKAPSLALRPIFQQFRGWFKRFVAELLAHDVQLTDDVRGVFDRMLASDAAIAEAEAAVRATPMFTTAASVRMSQEEFAVYQQSIEDAGRTARDTLERKLLRDLQREQRADYRAEKQQIRETVQAEVYARPVYQALAAMKTGTHPDGTPLVEGETPEPLKLSRQIIEERYGKERLAALPRYPPPIHTTDGGMDPDVVAELFGFASGDALLTAISEALPMRGLIEAETTKRMQAQAGDLMVETQLSDLAKAALANEHREAIVRIELQTLARLRRAATAGATKERDYERRWFEAEAKLRIAMAEGRKQAEMDAQEENLTAKAKADAVKLRAAKQVTIDALKTEISTLKTKARTTKSDAAKERAYERRWLEAEAKLRIAIAEGHKQVEVEEAIEAGRVRAAEIRAKKQAEIDALDAEVKALKAQARGGAARINAALPSEADLREVARARIGRTTIKNLKPLLFWTAAKRAGEQATASAARQDFDKALGYKQQELTSLALFREATRVVDEVEAQVKAAQKLDQPSSRQRIGLAGASYQEQIDSILDRYEFASISGKALRRRLALRAWIVELEKDGMPADFPASMLDDARQVHYKELTVDELAAVSEALKQIVHLAHLKNTLLANKDMRDFAAMRDKVEASLREHGTERKLGPTFREKDERRLSVRLWFASHARIATLAQVMDGRGDGGAMWEAFARPANEAATAKEERFAAEGTAYAAILEKHYPGRALGKLHELMHIPAINASLTLDERLAVAKNWGNETSRDRMRSDPHRKWTDAHIQAILDTLTANDLAYVQATFDFVNKFWPEIAAKTKRLTGIEPEKVEAVPITAKAGTIPGGYYPLVADRHFSAKTRQWEKVTEAKLQTSAAYVSQTTRRGHLETRVAHAKYTVKLDGGVIFRHLEQVIHDLTHHEMLIDTTRLLRDPKIADAIYETAGEAVYEQFTGALEAMAAGKLPAGETMADTAATFMRQRTQIALLGYNLWTALQQPFGISNGIERVGARWVARGLARWLTDTATMESTVGWIHSVSPMMRGRDGSATPDIHDVREALQTAGGWFDTLVRTVTANKLTQQNILDSYLWHIGLFQRVADVPTWLGQYEKSMAAGEPEDRAIALADQAVIDSQGSGRLSDLSTIQRGRPAARMFMMFYAYGSATYNATYRRAGQTNFRSPVQVAQFLGGVSLIYIWPSVLTVALSAALRGGDDDDDEWVPRFLSDVGRESIASALNGMVLVRELAQATSDAAVVAAGGEPKTGGVRGYAGPAGARPFQMLMQLMAQAKQGELDEGLWKALNAGAGLLFRYPAAQVQRTVDGWMALEEGDTDNPAALLLGPPRK